jgi:hypothetical membrane protein
MWLFVGIGFIAQAVLNILKPGVLAQLIEGTYYLEGMKITQEVLLFWAVIFLFPLVMAILSLMLKDNVNRWANIIVGIVVVILCLIGFTEEMGLAQPDAYAILILIARIIVAALIIWLAYKWPKERA